MFAMVIKFPKRTPPGIEYLMITRDGSKIAAVIGRDLVVGVGGFGDTIPEALRDLAKNFETEDWRSSSVY